MNWHQSSPRKSDLSCFAGVLGKTREFILLKVGGCCRRGELSQQFCLGLIESILSRILWKHDLNCILIDQLFCVHLSELLILVDIIIANFLGLWSVALPTVFDLILIHLELSKSGIARGRIDNWKLWQCGLLETKNTRFHLLVILVCWWLSWVIKHR